MPHDVFISYCHADESKAESIAKFLESQGIRCWLDKTGLRLSQQYDKEIAKAIRKCSSPKYLAVVSNRAEWGAGEIVRWHWEKTGTIEHVHRVMKDELGAGVMPSGRFGVNAAWLRINALTFNVLTVLKGRALPERYRVARPKRLRFEVFTLPGRLAVHQSRLSVGISASEQRIGELVAARERLLDLRNGVESAC